MFAMRKITLLAVFWGWLFFSCYAQIYTYAPDAARAQEALEGRFDGYIRPQNLDEWNRLMSSRPHHVGSPWGKANAEFMAAKFREWGYEVEIETYQVLFPTPKVRILEMTAPTAFRASLEEPPVEGDASSQQIDEMLQPYNCFSVDGDVTGELVFVNYGVPADYEELARRGLDVRGKIVIAKYGGSWRGIKPKVAAEMGAVGCIIYSDPEDDGYFQGDTYPEGAFKNPYGVQRGSVLDMPLRPGDPLTPGYGATADALRISKESADNLIRIPVLPISWVDAQPLLAAMGGPVAPESWRGALPVTYHLGPGPAVVRLKLEFNWELQPAYNVIAKMPGSTYPDEWVIRGNHHDAWVHGASDPVSGMVALMEEARAISELAKTGWRPARTLVFCAWDAEEPALLGSTEWVEDHADELRKKAVVYINTDSNSRGFLGGGGSHTLEKYFDEVSKSVVDPQTGVSVFARLNARQQADGGKALSHYKLGALGSGSDYTPFIQHLGIASINLGFGGEGNGGEYHTGYDSYEHYTRFKDPGFVYGAALAKVAGRLTLRMANATILPFDFEYFTQTIEEYLADLMQTTDRLRTSTERENQMIRAGLYALAADPTQTFVEPQLKAEIPYINFAPLQNRLAELRKSMGAYQTALQKAAANPTQQAAVNAILKNIERSLTREEGLPRRPWYKHHIYAPGFYTGYGVKTLPGVREAIEQRNFGEAQAQIEILSEVLGGFVREMDKATKLLKG